MGTLVTNFNFMLSNCEVNTPVVDTLNIWRQKLCRAKYFFTG